jgi:putative FmdB family regulatory protein
MPIYEYHCKECDSTFDTLVRNLGASDDVTCESCSSTNVRRLISRFAMVGGFDDTFVAGDVAGSAGGCCGGSCGCGH